MPRPRQRVQFDSGPLNAWPRWEPIGRAISSFSPRSVSRFAARNYQHELRAASTWPVARSMIEGAVTGVIAEKAFASHFADGTPGWIIATLTAAPAFSNITSFLWSRLADGRHTVRNLNLLQCLILLLIAVMAAVPVTQVGLYIFMVAAVAARMVMAGVVTLRSVIWRSNYVRSERARITGKLITIEVQITAFVGIMFGFLMDESEASFRFVYPLAILFGLIGVRFYSKMRVRHPHRVTVKPLDAHEEKRTNGRSLARVIAGWMHTLREMLGILRKDAAFRGFMICMFVMGISNLAVMAPLIKLTATDFELDYLKSLLILQSIPLAIIPLAIPFWSRLFERMHVIRFRVYHSWVFVLAHVVTYLAAAAGSVPLLALSAAIRGFGFGGGALAWNIGHNDFATREQAGLYMTIHVTLTGLRGLIGAYLGIMLFSGLSFGGVSLQPIEPLREHSFLFWAAIGTCGALGFAYLNWRMKHITSQKK